MENKNVTFNCTLEQYNKKYKNRKHRLLKYTKKHVEDFDKQYGHYIYNNKTHSLEFNKYLLGNRKWALIGDTYYEIPKPIRFTWFRNLNAGVQIGTCVLLAGAVAGGAYGITYVLTHKEDIAIIDSSLSEYLKISGVDKDNEGNTVIHLTILKQGSKEPDIFKGNHKLIVGTECGYGGDPQTGSFEIIVYKAAMEKYSGQIVIKEKAATYNIDWCTNKFDLGDGTAKTLYEYAKLATKIEIVKDETEGSVSVGDTTNDKVYASWNDSGTEKTLKVWAKNKIVYDDDDVPDKRDSKNLFTSCENLISFNCSNIDTSKMTFMEGMFSECKNIKSLLLTGFDTSSTNNMNSMFSGCSSLISLDISSFNTSKVTDLTSMFADCQNLIVVYASNTFITEKVNESYRMFYGCKSLVGKHGTEFTTDHVNKEYARIDGGPTSSKPGYFTNVKDKPTKASFISEYGKLRTKFNNATSIYQNAQVKLTYWSGAVTEDLKISYEKDEGIRKVKFKNKKADKTGYFGTTKYSDDDLERYLDSETVDKVIYIVNDNFIEYFSNDNTQPNIHTLKINNHGYIESEYSDALEPANFGLTITDNPQEQISLSATEKEINISEPRNFVLTATLPGFIGTLSDITVTPDVSNVLDITDVEKPEEGEGTASVTISLKDGYKTTGTVNVTFACPGYISAVCKISIVNKYVQLDIDKIENLLVGGTKTITASLSDGGSGQFEFSIVEGDDVISKSQTGNKATITALKAGNAKISAYCVGYGYAECTVSVITKTENYFFIDKYNVDNRLSIVGTAPDLIVENESLSVTVKNNDSGQLNCYMYIWHSGFGTLGDKQETIASGGSATITISSITWGPVSKGDHCTVTITVL